ncbi:DNA methyltransferase [Poseidonibacter ostreae]|uniref:site-specific DNA-methyltransferase (adenine-specific) n=1 Tax=Poseidonibacter ostreae TaxID=2654171 RepID=A0A6L4WTQ5_9BACT|nr:site-specific DNA-methyltransferase [Poseidonibacter ostreae]KAB7889541.1 site-specific DNA-methyltransferase [Poseidonibacter ostreae]
MNEKQRKLIELLKEIFQLNQTDLDFGIYRIMNQKADEINDFLNNQLIQSIKSAFIDNNSEQVQKDLDEAIKQAQALGADPESLPKVKELREKISSSSNNESNENEIYSYLTNFFSRYYKDGDFVSLRRYKKDTYSIPYEGEEVKLHWANSDQYYIKTSEFFRDYTFTVNSKKFHFKIVDADTEKNNNKANTESVRRFVIDEENPIIEEDGELYIRFEYKPIGKTAQNKLNEKAVEIILAQESELINELKKLAPTEKNKNRTICEKHLTDYTSRNSFDYFIHKDLNGFLSRELDFYIKNEILYIDDILEATSSKIEDSLNKVKTFKTIANKIIAFVSQLENFQKKLWLKKKFIIDTNYCITLDKIDESYYEEILSNEKQLEEWKALFSVKVNSVEDLKKEKFLVLDTKFFNSEFKDKLLSEFNDIDEECDGVLINSENFGALNILQARYKEQVKTVYIDPPYNTGSDGFLYNDNYKHSSWMSLMNDRIDKSYSLLNCDGKLFTQIDYLEKDYYKLILDKYFTSEMGLPPVSIRTATPAGFKVVNPGPVNVTETVMIYGKENKTLNSLYTKAEYQSDYNKIIINPQQPLEEWETQSLTDFAINKLGYENRKEINQKIGKEIASLLIDKKKASLAIQNADHVFATYGPHKPSPKVQEGILKSKDNPTKFIPVKRDDGGNHYLLKGRLVAFYKFKLKELNDELVPTKRLTDFWDDISWDSISNEGNVELKNGKKPEKLLQRIIDLNIERKDNAIVLDFFAGSGTTPAVSHKLGKKYIAVEMGEYFDTLTLIRMKHTLNGNSNGIKPIINGGMFKYFKLESYEDTLNNLAFKEADQNLFSEDVKEDYLLNYMLDYETNESLLNIDDFKKPFDYKLNIASSSVGETIETNVDLVETFNYLIGLKVKTRTKIKGFVVIEGENLKKEKVLIIWREDNDNNKLNDFFSKMDFSVYDREFDTIYVNGDNNLANLKKDEDHFKVKLIEEEFKNRMFGE